MTETVENAERERDDLRTAVNVNLFKEIGLYQLLQPVTGHGTVQTYRRTILTVMSLVAGLLSVQFVCVYTTVGELQQFMYMAGTIVLLATGWYKMYVLVMNADRLWAVLDIARIGFTCCGRRNPTRLRQCRDTLFVWLRMFVTFFYVAVALWIVTPWFIKERIPFVKLDGTVVYYRPSILDYWWFPVSESTYNRWPVWVSINVVESFVCLPAMLSYTMFDCYIYTVCVVLNTQFDIMSDTYETMGHPSRPPSGSSGIQQKEMVKESDHYEELIVNIKDNTKITKILDDFYDIIKPVVIIHTFIGSFAMISYHCIISVMLYKHGVSLLSALVLKNIFSSGLHTAVICSYCYLFNRVETAKSKLNFGLYCSNWTEMSLKFQKTLLLAMNMNSAHMRQMRISPKLIINMEMFGNVLHGRLSITETAEDVKFERDGRQPAVDEKLFTAIGLLRPFGPIPVRATRGMKVDFFDNGNKIKEPIELEARLTLRALAETATNI